MAALADNILNQVQLALGCEMQDKLHELVNEGKFNAIGITDRSVYTDTDGFLRAEIIAIPSAIHLEKITKELIQNCK